MKSLLVHNTSAHTPIEPDWIDGATVSDTVMVNNVITAQIYNITKQLKKSATNKNLRVVYWYLKSLYFLTTIYSFNFLFKHQFYLCYCHLIKFYFMD
jgi:hypothetical protein